MTSHLVRTTMLAATVTVLAMAGCEDENSRLARMAEEYSERQAEQAERMVELQRELAEGSRQLVAADAETRKEMAALQREVGRQQDQLEADRRAIAAQRRMDPIIAAALTDIGLILACLLPLVLCWYLLRRGPADDTEAAVNEILIEELVSERPLLLPPPDGPPSLAYRGEPATDGDSRDADDDRDQH